MLVTHMLAKKELNIHGWAVSLVALYGAAAIVVHAKYGAGAEYWVYAAVVVDILIGIAAGTKETRKVAKFVRDAEKIRIKDWEDHEKSVTARLIAAKEEHMRDYEFWFQDIIKEHGYEEVTSSMRHRPIELAGVSILEICGVPVLRRDGKIVVFIEESTVMMFNPEKVGSSESIVVNCDTNDTTVDARDFASSLGEPEFRYIHDKKEPEGVRFFEGNEEEGEIWVFNVKKISSDNLDNLDEFSIGSQKLSEGRKTGARKAMSTPHVDFIHSAFPAVALYITRLPSGVCEVFSIVYWNEEVLDDLACAHTSATNRIAS